MCVHVFDDGFSNVRTICLLVKMTVYVNLNTPNKLKVTKEVRNALNTYKYIKLHKKCIGYFLLKLELPYRAKHVWNAIIFTLAVLFIAKYVYTRYEQINFTKLELSQISLIIHMFPVLVYELSWSDNLQSSENMMRFINQVKSEILNTGVNSLCTRCIWPPCYDCCLYI